MELKPCKKCGSASEPERRYETLYLNGMGICVLECACGYSACSLTDERVDRLWNRREGV